MTTKPTFPDEIDETANNGPDGTWDVPDVDLIDGDDEK